MGGPDQHRPPQETPPLPAVAAGQAPPTARLRDGRRVGGASHRPAPSAPQPGGGGGPLARAHVFRRRVRSPVVAMETDVPGGAARRPTGAAEGVEPAAGG